MEDRPARRGRVEEPDSDGEVSPTAVIGTVLFNRAYFGWLGIAASPVASATTMVLP